MGEFLNCISNWINNNQSLAAWVQAVGSVLAIVYAANTARRSDRQRIADNNKITQIFMADFKLSLDRLIELAKDHNAYGINRVAANLIHTNQVGDQIDLKLLPYSVVVNFLTVREAIQETIQEAQAVTAADHWPYRLEKFKQIKQSVSGAIDASFKSIRLKKMLHLTRE